jgi:LysR family transcriptional activator of mexEF-oprN operon
LPFALEGTAMELLWRRATDDDPALAFVRAHVVRIAKDLYAPPGPRATRKQRAASA